MNSQRCGQPTVTGGACRNPARSCAANHPPTGAGPVIAMTAASGPDPLTAGAHRGPLRQVSRQVVTVDGEPLMIDFGVTAVRDHGHHDQCLAATLDALDDDQVAAVAAGALRDPRFVQHAGGAVLETLEMIDPDSPYTYETGSVDVVVDRHDGIGVDLILDLSPAETARLARGCEWPGLAPTTKSTVRERLAGLTDPQAAEAALLTLGGGWVWQAYGDAISDSVDGYLSHLAEDPDTDPELLSRLAAHPDRAVRERFAAHPNMPAAARSHIGLLDD